MATHLFHGHRTDTVEVGAKGTPAPHHTPAGESDWRGAVWRRAGEMNIRLSAVEQGGPATETVAIVHQLGVARQLASVPCPWWSYWASWFKLMPQANDALCAEACRSLALADAQLLLLESPDAAMHRVLQVRAELDRMRVPTKVRTAGGQALQRFLDAKDHGEPQARNAVSAAVLHLGEEAASTQKHWADFNSRLFGVSMWLLCGLIVLAAVALGMPSFLPLCAGSNGGAGSWCPNNQPPRGGVVTVAAIGALGGLVSTVMAVSRRPRTPVPDFVRATENGLRVPLGALVAVLGVLLLQSGIAGGAVSQFQPAQRPEVVLTWAAAFGFASILVAKLVDRKLSNFADEIDDPHAARQRAKSPQADGGGGEGG